MLRGRRMANSRGENDTALGVSETHVAGDQFLYKVILRGYIYQFINKLLSFRNQMHYIHAHVVDSRFEESIATHMCLREIHGT